jgi:hypothetical protein
MSTNDSKVVLSKEEIEAKKAEAQRLFDEAQETLRNIEREEREAKYKAEREERARAQEIADALKCNERDARAMLLLAELHKQGVPATFDKKSKYDNYSTFGTRFDLLPNTKGYLHVYLGILGTDVIVLEHKEHYATGRSGYERNHRYFKEVKHIFRYGKKGFNYEKIAKTVAEEVAFAQKQLANEQEEVINEKTSLGLAQSIIISTKIGRHNSAVSVSSTKETSDKVVVNLRSVSVSEEEAIQLIAKFIDMGLVTLATAEEVTADKKYFKEDKNV